MVELGRFAARSTPEPAVGMTGYLSWETYTKRDGAVAMYLLLDHWIIGSYGRLKLELRALSFVSGPTRAPRSAESVDDPVNDHHVSGG